MSQLQGLEVPNEPSALGLSIPLPVSKGTVGLHQLLASIHHPDALLNAYLFRAHIWRPDESP